jgi:hypothetical protein
MADAAELPVSLLPVQEEALEVALLLPENWTVEIDGGTRLTCVADKSWERNGFRPSITVERYPNRSREQVAALAASTLATMREAPDAYPDFEFQWAQDEAGSDRVVRCYEFRLPGLGQRVRQVQALVAGDALFVVNCTEAADDPRLDGTFVEIVRSVSG